MTKNETNLGGAVPRYLAILVAVVLGLSLFPATAFAQTASDGDACAAVDEEDAFPDDDGTTHEDNINCVAAYNIAQGFADGTYKPGRSISRGQMATFIANFLDTAGFDLPEGSPDAFPDDDNSVHEGNINIIADAGIVQGFADGTYRPNRDVSREQMATYIANAIEADMQETMPAGDDAFTDDETSVHESNINKLAEAEVVVGTGGTSYSPRADVTRGQMASFIINAADYLDAHGEWLPTAGASLALASTTAQAGGNITGVVSGDVTGVSVSGCGLTNQTLTDSDAAAEGFQFTVTIPSGQAAGDCELTFTITQGDGSTLTITRTITVTGQPAGTGVTTRPELVSAAIVSTTTTGEATTANPAGTIVRYTFDEPVIGAGLTPALFHIYRFNNPNTQVSGNSATVDPDNNRAVLVRFNTITTRDADPTTGVNNFTVATVDLGAATDNQNQVNPEGDAPIGQNQDRTLQAGQTTAPDLVSVGRFGGTPTANEAAVDFTFDAAANVQNTTGFHLILTDGTDLSCTGPGPATTNQSNPGGQNAPGGNGTTTITVVCGPVSAANSTRNGAASQPSDQFFNQAPSATNTARGVVDSNTVGTQPLATNNCAAAANVCNPLETSNTPDQATTTPDLVSARFVPGTGTNNDAAIYLFDEDILATGITTANFRVYNSDGSETPTPISASRNPSNTREVIVQFANGALSNAVGASVTDGAVQSAAGTNRTNQEDEVGVNNPAGTQVQPGRTDAPDLLTVELSSQTDPAGNITGWTATYTFDERIDQGPAPAGANFFLHLADGARMVCAVAPTVGTGGSTPNNSQATCNSYTFVAGQAGTNSGAATAGQIGSATLGTVNNNAVQDAAGNQNPEGAAATSGGTGSPQQ